MPIKEYVCKAKNGSKRFRRVLAYNGGTVEIENLRTVHTFFGLLSVPIPDPAIIGKLHGIWTWHFLSKRLWFFVFQFYNNSLGTKTRIAARYRNAGNFLDQRCAFCLKSGSLVPMREDFIHVFYDCPYVIPLVVRAYDVYFKHRLDEAKKNCAIWPVPSKGTKKMTASFMYWRRFWLIIQYGSGNWKICYQILPLSQTK